MPELTELEIVNMALVEVGSKKVNSISDKDDISLQQHADLARDATLGMYDWKFARKRARVSAAGILNASTRTIAFVDSSPDTITDSASGFVTAGAESGDIVKSSNTTDNDTGYNIDSVVAGTITLESYEEVTAESIVNSTTLKMYFSPASKWLYKYEKPSGFLRLLSINDYKSNGNKWDLEGNFIVTNDIDTNDQILIRYIKSVTDTTVWTDLFVDVYVPTLAARLTKPLKRDLNEGIAFEAKARQVLRDGLASMAGEGEQLDERDGTPWQKAGH